jgi:hypothetical protein
MATESAKDAARLGCSEQVQAFIANSTGPDDLSEALSTAIGLGRLEIVKLLANGGLDAAQRQAGWKSLCRLVGGYGGFGAQFNRTVVYFLLRQGAPPDPQEGCVPLAIAARFGTEGVVAEILARGPDMEARDRQGRTALHAAAADYKPGIVRLLIQHDADVNTKDRYGSSPIQSSFGDREITRLLIDAGADVNDQSQHGLAALRLAAEYGRVGVIEDLINAGADVNLRDDYGRTPLFHAAKCNHLEAIELLMTAGADPSLVDHKGRTALEVGEEKTAQFIRERIDNASPRN